MKLTDLENSLVKALAEFEIIDCHEHLGPEKNRLAAHVDVFTLFSHYTRGDLLVAGMSEADYTALFNPDIPLERRWAIFAPYWERIRWGSYARAALLAAERFYGVSDINEHTYQPLSLAIQANNTPGIYERVLRDACRIRTALTQCGSTDLGGTPRSAEANVPFAGGTGRSAQANAAFAGGTPLLTPVMPLAYEMDTWPALAHPSFAPEAAVRSLDDYLDAVRRYVVRVKAEGAVGLKMMSNPYQTPNRADALSAFNRLQGGGERSLPVPNPLRDYVVDETIAFAAQQDLVVCVHTGYWGDFRVLDPLHMIPILQRHPRARFDIYHLGYPWMREAIMLGKGFPNVWLNLCWCHIISQRFVVTALDELIDVVPMNKILAFGGDYGLPVEKVYGHLVMAREDIARVLALRIAEGQMTESQALDLAHQWFWDNPKELYRLKV